MFVIQIPTVLDKSGNQKVSSCHMVQWSSHVQNTILVSLPSSEYWYWNGPTNHVTITIGLLEFIVW